MKLEQKDFEETRANLALALSAARLKCEEAFTKLHTLEIEQFAEEGDNIYNIPFQYTVTGTLQVYAKTLDIAYDKVMDARTPPGEYLDDSWENNPSEESEESMIIGVVRL